MALIGPIVIVNKYFFWIEILPVLRRPIAADNFNNLIFINFQVFNIGLNARLKMGENLRKPLQPVPKPSLALVAQLKFIARLMTFEATSSLKCLSQRTQPAHRAISL